MCFVCFVCLVCFVCFVSMCVVSVSLCVVQTSTLPYSIDSLQSCTHYVAEDQSVMHLARAARVFCGRRTFWIRDSCVGTRDACRAHRQNPTLVHSMKPVGCLAVRNGEGKGREAKGRERKAIANSLKAPPC